MEGQWRHIYSNGREVVVGSVWHEVFVQNYLVLHVQQVGIEGAHDGHEICHHVVIIS